MMEHSGKDLFRESTGNQSLYEIITPGSERREGIDGMDAEEIASNRLSLTLPKKTKDQS